MFNLKAYDVPIDLLIHVILRFISYFDLDSVLPCFRLTPKEIANIKYKIYKQRIKITKKLQAIEYTVEGKLHREEGPAIDWLNVGTKSWWLNGDRHRSDGPSIECTNGYKAWWVHGSRHRVDGPAVIYTDGHKEWWLNGEFIRSDF